MFIHHGATGEQQSKNTDGNKHFSFEYCHPSPTKRLDRQLQH